MASSCRVQLFVGILPTSFKMPPCTRILVFSLLITCLVQTIFARPLSPNSTQELELMRVRRSGISDQRLAELEAIIAMSRARRIQHAGHHGKLHSTASYGYGMFNPEEIG
ncbi:hypothetical protein RvY_05729 [Ramazzottius varieornatus]|uniref:Uncharacterized protein n=1 Tax=Ramazzottius varieornatus TaxID=947166 RepID=A0A1D1UWK1_RAMVA|nr:hypothetical protein RvY_05729 [Ramazzottius varieornatus]